VPKDVETVLPFFEERLYAWCLVRRVKNWKSLEKPVRISVIRGLLILVDADAFRGIG
jgi:hypothetical protein